MKKAAYNIYREMLEYGSKHIENGVSLSEIIEHLIEKELYEEARSQDYLKQWFEWSFEHKEKGCKCELRPDNDCGCDKDDPCYDFDHMMNCKHFINKQACLDLLQLKESENNLKSSSTATTISYIAIGIALISILSPLIFDKCYETEELKELRRMGKLDSVRIERLNDLTDKVEDLSIKTNSLSDSQRINFDRYLTIDNEIKGVNSKISIMRNEVNIIKETKANKASD